MNKKNKGKSNVKYYELTIILPKEGRSYLAIVPSVTSGAVIDSLDHIVKYMQRYGEIKFNVNSLSR